MGQREQAGLVAAYLDACARLRTGMLAALLALWGDLSSWRDEDAQEFAEQAAPVVVGSQEAMATLTDAYLAMLLGDMLGALLQVAGVTLPDNLRGVPPEQVYQRPFVDIWRALADDVPLPEAVRRGGHRMQNLATTDLQLAKTHAVRQALAARPQVVGYRRVLTGSENCGLCVIASTQRYHRAELLPIHPGCDCAVAPLLGDQDPGQVINAAKLTKGATATGATKTGVRVFAGADVVDAGELLDPLHQAVQERFGASDRGGRQIDYRKVITVHEHGEIGPVLSVKGQAFTGPDDI